MLVQPLSGLKPVMRLASQRLLGSGLMVAGRVRRPRHGLAGLNWCLPERGRPLGSELMLAGLVRGAWSDSSVLG